MGTRTLIPVEEYLRTGFEGPEPDYVEAELVERSVPNSLHSQLQTDLVHQCKLRQNLGVFCYPENRLRVAFARFTVADVAVFSVRQVPAIPEDTPLAVIEVVSPDDRHDGLMHKLDDYQNMGIPRIYVVNPPFRRVSHYRDGELKSVDTIELGASITIPVSSIFND
jgi:Uma2 family endonuclease